MNLDHLSIKQIGNSLEEYIKYRNIGYKNEKIADIKKANEAVVILSKKNNKITNGFIKEKSDLDWYGMTREHGFIKFDTKACKGDRLKLSAISDGQIQIMRDSLDYDMKTFILVWHYEKDIFYMIPGIEVIKAKDRYIELKGFNRRAPKGSGYIDLNNYEGHAFINSMDYLSWIDF